MKVATILTTVGIHDGARFAQTLIETRVAACVERIAAKSAYNWNGNYEDNEELSVIVKTPWKNRRACIKEIRRIHPYECPQILAFAARSTDKRYNAFLNDTTRIRKPQL